MFLGVLCLAYLGVVAAACQSEVLPTLQEGFWHDVGPQAAGAEHRNSTWQCILVLGNTRR
jgi:hypothetical protein